MKKKNITLIAILVLCFVCSLSLAACKKNASVGKSGLTFRHYVENDTAELGGKYVLNKNNAYDADGNAYKPVITVKRGNKDITDQVKDYVLDVTEAGDFTVDYKFRVKKSDVVYTTRVHVTDASKPEILLSEELPDELEYQGVLTLPEIRVIDGSGATIVPDVKVYGNYAREENLISGTDGNYTMPSSVTKALVDISATDASGNTGRYQKTIRVRRNGEKDIADVNGLIKGLSLADSSILADGSAEYVYCADTIDGGAVADEVLTVETEGAFITANPTLVFVFPTPYRAHSVIALDIYMENMTGWMSLFPLYGGATADPEYGLRDKGFRTGKWLHVEHVFDPKTSDKYDPNGKIDSLRLTFPAPGYGGDGPAIVDPSKGMVIKVANLTVREVPVREDLSGELGLVGNISANGSFFVNYPFATTEKGILSDGNTDALKITIPADTAIKHSTLIFDLDKTYPIGSVVSFDWEVQNMDLDALVSGYDGKDMATQEIRVTSNRCNISLPAKTDYAGDGFNKVALYLRFDVDGSGLDGAEITILIANLTVRELPERGDYPELGLVNDISESGSFFTNYPFATKTKDALSDGTAALKLTIPADAEIKTSTLMFDLGEQYPAGSIASFDWEVSGMALDALVSGYDGKDMATDEIHVTTERCSVALPAKTDYTGDGFDKVALYLRFTGHTSGEITILIANLTVREAPERGDYPGLGLVNNISENGSFFVHYPFATKTEGTLTDGGAALKLTIPADSERNDSTLIFDLNEQYPAGSIVSFDWEVTNMKLDALVSGYDGSVIATSEEHVTANHCNVVLGQKAGYAGEGFDKVALLLRLKTQKEEYSGEIVILIANLTVREAPQRGDYPELGLVNNIGESGSFFTNYPFASKTKGSLSDGTPALKLTVPADAEIKTSTLMFDLGKKYPAGSRVSFDWEVQNMTQSAVVSGYDGGTIATNEASVTTEHCRTTLTFKQTYDGTGFDKLLLYLPMAGHTDGEITILIANLRVDDLSGLGELGKIGTNGNVSSFYPSALFAAGKIGEGDALELIVPKGTVLPNAVGELSFDLALSKEYAVGSVIEFAFEMDNAALYTAVTGYDGGAVITTGASVTSGKGFVVTAKAASAGKDAFKNILFYFQLNRGGNNANIDENNTVKADIKIRLANLRITEPSELTDLGEALGVDMTDSFRAAAVQGKVSYGLTDVTVEGGTKKALEIMVDFGSFDSIGTHNLLFTLSESHQAGSVISFYWETDNMKRIVYITGGAATTQKDVWLGDNAVSFATVAKPGAATDTFNKLDFYFNASTFGETDKTNPVVIRITDLKVTPPPPSKEINGCSIDESSPILTANSTVTRGKLSDGITDCFVVSIPKKEYYEKTSNHTTWKILYLKLDKEYAAGTTVEVKMEYEGWQEREGKDFALKWGGDYGGGVDVDGGFVGYDGMPLTLNKTMTGTINKLQFTPLRAVYTPDVTPEGECVILKIAVTLTEPAA